MSTEISPNKKADEVFKTLVGYTYNDVKILTQKLIRLAETEIKVTPD